MPFPCFHQRQGRDIALAALPSSIVRELAGDWQDRFLKLPVFESGVWRARLGDAPAFEPGTRELAEAVGQAARDFEAVWMTRHGLCASAPCLGQALTLSEELEHLAAIQLLAGSC